jgi:SAM-dependent methyltransferase
MPTQLVTKAPPRPFCPVCGGLHHRQRFRAHASGTEQGVDPSAFRPSAAGFGVPAGTVVSCIRCGHGFVATPPPSSVVSDAYAAAADPVSIREEASQVETARRALARIGTVVAPGRACDLGCWTGSFLIAATEAGWDPVGLEPSTWASERARARGLHVLTGDLSSVVLPSNSFRLVVMSDVLEHLADPGSALTRVAELLEPGGALWLTVPDAGSQLARIMGSHWWSVLPMHLQYFTQGSVDRLLRVRGLVPRWQGSHAKVFTARYYAERLADYHPGMGRAVVALLERAGMPDRLVAPDFRDRLAVLCTKLL